MAAWTGLVLMLQANGKKHVNKRKVSPGMCWGYAHGHILLCDCEDHAGSVMWGNHKKNLQEGTTFWGCLTIFRVWQGHCLYSINTKLMLLGNSTHERSRKLPDMPNMTSAKCSNCRLHNIIFQRKRTGERRGWKHRAEEISKELMGYRRTDNMGMTNISAEGGRACRSICEDCTTKLSEAAFKQNGVHIFPLSISLSACIQPLLALSLPLTPWKLEASSSWKFQGLAGLTTLPRKLHWSTSLSFPILSTAPGHAATAIQGWSCWLCQPLEQSTFGCNGSVTEKLKLRSLEKTRYHNA